MSIRRINPQTLYPAVPYDYAVVATAGHMLFMAGACPLDSNGYVVAPGDFEAQARQALDNLFAVLEEAGSTAEQVLKTTVFVTASDRDELERVWEVVEEGFSPARPPSTLLGVSILGYPGQLVEIEAVALVSNREPLREADLT